MTFASVPAVRVLVVDDSQSFRECARALVDATDGFEWIGDATCGEEGVEQTAELMPDLVLMDVRMPGIGGIEAARLIASTASTGALPATMMASSAVRPTMKFRQPARSPTPVDPPCRASPD